MPNKWLLASAHADCPVEAVEGDARRHILQAARWLMERTDQVIVPRLPRPMLRPIVEIAIHNIHYPHFR